MGSLMDTRKILLGLVAVIHLVDAPARAQQSPSHKLTESTFNEGGHPAGGVVLTSAGYRITLDAVGDAARPTLVTGPSWRMHPGFVPAYRPPGEALNLLVDPDRVTFRWDPERSVGSYNLYRGLLSTLSGLGYGTCLQQSIAGETATDASIPSTGAGYFYIVTAENRLTEEGTKGFDSSGAERLGAFCP
jgi:hypothetical protein